jgi:hypothetical protein
LPKRKLIGGIGHNNPPEPIDSPKRRRLPRRPTAPTVDPLAGDVLWGCTAIANAIGRSERATFHLLSAGYIPATKTGAIWTSTRTALRRHFEARS